MGSINGDEWESRSQNQDHHSSDGEKIYVAVRVRPLSGKEISKNDLSDWECINNNTIIFKNTLEERSMLPTAYTFDRVFGFNSPTKHVYDEAAKKVAMSVLSGINSTIFAYGQTGSGKTFTMRGITECAIRDIYDYIPKHHDRKFVLKFCAMEIYNEAVRDLLRTDTAPLRLLDDPERGTIVANLTEVTLNDQRQLKELLYICEAQRQIGETSLNEMSSRSHQILRLTVESEAIHYMGVESSSTLTATVNFVDLAGSERASQTLSAGTRLKEGGHINRSLLTLGTVIRKLSKGGKSGHIPYRDSKLTRILQTSLAGNARTAIICTMSPAHTHVEQSRNTLHFANCAKQVHTNAQVNVVMSEKALVKQLQKELARMESELKHIQSVSHSGSSKTALKEKEILIQKMDQEIRELTHQRDMAQTRVENMLRGGDQSSKSWNYVHNQDRGCWTDEYAASEASELMDPLRLEVVSRSSTSDRYEGIVGNKIEDQFSEEQFLISTMSPKLDIDKYFGPDPCQGMENDFSRRNSVSRKSMSKNLSRNSISNANSPHNVISPRKKEYGQSPSTREYGQSPHRREYGQSPHPRQYGQSTRTREYGQSPSTREYGQSPSTREYGQSPRNRDYGQSPRNRDYGQSPRIREHMTGRSLTSSDFEAPDARSRTDKNCEAILAAIMKGSGREVVKESEKVSLIETVNPEKVSVKKTLAALMRENSLRLSNTKMQSIADSYYREDSPRFSDASIHESYSDALSRQSSGKQTQSNSVAISRDNSRKHYDVNTVSNSDSFSGQRSLYDELPTKDYMKQKEVSTKEFSIVKHSENDLVSPSKKEKTNSYSEETTPVKAKKERTEIFSKETAEVKDRERRSSGSEEITEGKTKKDRTSKAKKERKSDEGKNNDTDESWKIQFERRKREIIKLWDACHIPLVHRSYFCLLFKGDPSDAVYMEVEHRRLSFLKTEGKSTNDDLPSSPKALLREREMLSRRMLKKLSTKEREALFQKWDIDVKSKQRRQQLCRKLWTDTDNMEHINESAAIVAKLAGLKEAGQAPKEMFGLSLAPKQATTRAFSWKHPIPSII